MSGSSRPMVPPAAAEPVELELEELAELEEDEELPALPQAATPRAMETAAVAITVRRRVVFMF